MLIAANYSGKVFKNASQKEEIISTTNNLKKNDEVFEVYDNMEPNISIEKQIKD